MSRTEITARPDLSPVEQVSQGLPTGTSSGVTRSSDPNVGILDVLGKQTTTMTGVPTVRAASAGHTTSATAKANVKKAQQAVTALVPTCLEEGRADATKVYDALSKILAKVAELSDFSADTISTSLNEALTDPELGYSLTDKDISEGRAMKINKEPTVGKYDPDIDGTERRKDQIKSEQGYPTPDVWTKDPDAKAQAHGECMSRCTEAGLKSGREKNPKNVKIDEDYLRKFQKGTVGVNIRGHHPYRISWPKDFDVSAYSGQIAYESNTFSGDVKIHKLEPGTVLVRVFGQGQSVKTACWCRADDATSSVTCAQDLYKKLAVKAEWNGDGNLGVFIVPEGVDIWVAEGTIASQIETYTGNVQVNGRDRKQKHSFLYEGGGTQVNILTPNPPEQSQVEGPVEELHPELPDNPKLLERVGKRPSAYATFAGIYPDVFEKCMFCFRNDGIMEPKVQEPKAQS